MSIERYAEMFNKHFMRGWVAWSIVSPEELYETPIEELYSRQDDEFGLYLAGGEL